MQAEALDAILSSPLNRGLAADIALRLRTAILHGYFGPGERLREEALAKSMGVSRGPIREAFSQLEREGLVVIQRNRGTFVARLTREDAEEIYSLRRVLEGLAVERVIVHATDGQLDGMQRVIDTMAACTERGITEQEAAELDVAFHEMLYQASNHKRLYDCWVNLRRQIHILLLSRNVADADYRVVTVSSHQVILDALRERDTARTVALIEDHLRGSYERVTGSMPEPDDRPAGGGVRADALTDQATRLSERTAQRASGRDSPGQRRMRATPEATGGQGTNRGDVPERYSPEGETDV